MFEIPVRIENSAKLTYTLSEASESFESAHDRFLGSKTS